MNVVSVDEDWDVEKDPLPEILKGVSSYNEYTWVVKYSYENDRFWWLFAPNAKMTVWGSISG